MPKGEIAKGLYPQPPNLALTARQYSDAGLFWIVKHGLRLTGMPAWAEHSDEELWTTVAFVRKLPAMTPEEYAGLVTQSMAHRPHRQDHDAPAALKGPGSLAPERR